MIWVRSCGLFVDAFLSWRIGYNRMCTNGRQTVFLQYGSSCEFLKGPYSSHENHTYGRHEVLRPKFFDTGTIQSSLLKNCDLFLIPFFPSYFQKDINRINDTFIVQGIKQTELFSGFDLVDFSQMPIQVGGLVGTKCAQMASKWFFSCMNPHVNF